MYKPTIGLFGTCGDSNWRDAFIAEYKKAGIPFFNPQVPEWKPEFAEVEAEHLAKDEILLFPVTAETYGTGSLSETGFSILKAISLNKSRDIIVMIDPLPSQKLKEENPTAYKESVRARTLVLAHLKELELKNVYLVENLEQMLEVSLTLYSAECIRGRAKKFSLGG